jgi:hypothetical protein
MERVDNLGPAQASSSSRRDADPGAGYSETTIWTFNPANFQLIPFWVQPDRSASVNVHIFALEKSKLTRKF